FSFFYRQRHEPEATPPDTTQQLEESSGEPVSAGYAVVFAPHDANTTTQAADTTAGGNRGQSECELCTTGGSRSTARRGMGARTGPAPTAPRRRPPRLRALPGRIGSTKAPRAVVDVAARLGVLA